MLFDMKKSKNAGGLRCGCVVFDDLIKYPLDVRPHRLVQRVCFFSSQGLSRAAGTAHDSDHLHVVMWTKQWPPPMPPGVLLTQHAHYRVVVGAGHLLASKLLRARLRQVALYMRLTLLMAFNVTLGRHCPAR